MVTKKDLQTLLKKHLKSHGEMQTKPLCTPCGRLISERLTTSKGEDVVQLEPAYTAGMKTDDKIWRTVFSHEGKHTDTL